MSSADGGGFRLSDSSAARLRALVDAMSAITRVQAHPQEVLQQIVEAAQTVADAEYVALGITGRDGRTLQQFLHTGMDPATAERIGSLPTGHGVLGAVIVEGRALRLRDLADHPASYGFPDHHPPMTSFLGVPVRTRDRVVGNLYMTNKRGGGDFTDEDEALITALAGQAAIAIEMADRYTAASDLSDRLRRLVEINTILTAQRQVDHALQQIVNAAADLVGATYAGLGVLDGDGTSFSGFIHTGMDPDMVAAIGDLPSGRGVMRAVMVSGRPMRLSDIGDHPASVGFPENHPRMRSFLGVPLAFQGEVIGDLYLTDKRDAAEFTEADELVATALAAQAAVIVSNAAAYEREQRLVSELREADEAKEAFVHHVAHELKTPLVTIRGALQAMAQEAERRGEGQGAGDRVLQDMAVRQADRLMAMITSLLELAAIESGRSELALGPVALEDAVRHALQAAPPPEDRTVEVLVGETGPVVADARYLDRIVANLLTNAYRHGGPTITLAATEDPDAGTVVLTVSDDGDGVPDGLVAGIFERFTRGPGSEGTGLGLGLVRSLAERFGGGVAYRHGEGGGAVFEVTLPAAG